MTDRYRPTATPAEIRTAAEATISRIDSLTNRYVSTEGLDLLRPPLDPVAGVHSNLRIATDLADATTPQRKLTQRTLILETLSSGAPSIRLGLDHARLNGRVILTTPDGTNYHLTDQRINGIQRNAVYVPRRALLLNRFGLRAPQEFIGKARNEAAQEARRGRTIFSRFTGRGR